METGYTEAEEHIFKAAIREFAKNGKQGARLQAIADAAGVNKALVHYYFRSKDHLYEEVFDYIYKDYLTSLYEAFQQADTFEELLKTSIERSIDFAANNEGLPVLMFNELGFKEEKIKQKHDFLISKFGDTPFRVFSRKMKKAIDAGEIRALDPLQTFISLTGACRQIFVALPLYASIEPDLAKNRSKYIEERKKHIFTLFYYGLKKELKIDEF